MIRSALLLWSCCASLSATALPHAAQEAAPVRVRAVALGAPIQLEGEALEEAPAEDVTVDAEGSAVVHDADDGPIPVDAVEVVVLTSEGQRLSGRLDVAPSGRIGLRAEDFVQSLVLDPSKLAELEVEPPATSTEPAPLLFELTSGERLRGDLIELRPNAWVLDLQGVGVVELAPDYLAGIENLGGGDIVFNGPYGRRGWTDSNEGNAPWRADGATLVVEAPKGHIARDLGLDEGRTLDLRVSWVDEPGFRIGIGIGVKDEPGKEGVTVEAWGRTLVAWAERDDALELVELEEGLADDGTVSLRIGTDATGVTFLDQDGGSLGRIELEELRGPCLGLYSDRKGLTLEALYVLRSAEAAPRTIQGSEIAGFVPELGLFELGAPDAVEQLPLDAVKRIEFANAGSEVEPPRGHVWLKYTDGRRVCGRFEVLTESGLVLTPMWSTQPITCAVDALGLVEFVGGRPEFQRRRSSKSFLEASAGEIAGSLEAIREGGAIVWSPTIAEGSAEIERERVERIVVNRTTAYYVSSRKYPHYLQLRNGDAFRCQVRNVSGEELTFESPFGGERTIPASRVKAIELDVRTMDEYRTILAEEEEPQDQNRFFGWGNNTPQERDTDEGLDARSIERALTLPRKYKRRKVEHLILARTGDFLRTQLLSLDADGAEYPGPLEQNRWIARNRLAAIVWLDEPDAEAVDDALTSDEASRVVFDERTRVTMRLTKVEGGRLVGTSRDLGELDVDLAMVHAIELDEELLTAGSPYKDWVLRPMPEPFPEEDQPQPRPRVGEIAPELAGVDLAGEPLALSDHVGKVVLLDFWAHW